ncbi:MAG: hypothetical protein QXK76_00440 [Candidatus Woesearchaeota archaeon]
MGYLILIPKWFLMYSIFLEIIFAIITLTVSYYAFKVYKLTYKNNAKLFTTAFVFIFLSYLTKLMLNLIVVGKLADDVVSVINLRDVALLNLFGSYAHALFFIIGLIILAYIQFRTENIQILFLTIALVVVSIIFSWNKLMLFYLLATIILMFICFNYFLNYLCHRTINSTLVLIAMMFLLLGTLQYFFALDYELYYVVGHIFEFLSYALILINLLLILKHGKKKK